MSEENSSSAGGGVGVIGLLGVAFVVLKLTGCIKWSWWWVTAPFWVVFAIIIAIVAVAVLCAAAGYALKKMKRKKALAKG